MLVTRSQVFDAEPLKRINIDLLALGAALLLLLLLPLLYFGLEGVDDDSGPQ